MGSTITTFVDLEVGSDVKIRAVSKRSPPNWSNNVREPPTLVFLHFWGGSSATWSEVTSILATTSPTIAIDFRGWGSSTGPEDDSAYSIAQLASDVESVIRCLSLDQIVLVGHSMGGKVAQAVAGRKNISGLRGLVLVASAPPTPLMLPDSMREQQKHAYDSTEAAEYVVTNVLTAKNSEMNDLARKKLVEDMLRGHPYAKAAWPAYAMPEDISELAKKIDVPVLVVGADQDVVEPVERLTTEITAHIPAAKVEVIDGSGHLIPVERPERCAEIIQGFLGNLP
ncbi:alpha/beta-hydrolase [Thozetella sp. PMI_491]|nr:alpha/beta-hydrolase [Thozetella sp. PMI_491]